MPKKTELEGIRFGSLTVNTRKGISLSTKRVYWNCTCDCVSCCWTCNQAKRDMSFDGFKTWIKTVHDNVYKNEKEEQ